MKKLSASEAARGFSEVLDSVEAGGETFVVLRHGRPIARISPAAAGTGLVLKETLSEHPPDPDWAGELRDLRSGVGPGTDPWHD